MAVSALQCGLLPITQTAMRFLKIGYRGYRGVVLDEAERASLIKDLGQGEALMLRNHGALVVGRTMGEAFYWMHRIELACHSQLAAMACNTPLVPPPQSVLESTWNNCQRGTRRPCSRPCSRPCGAHRRHLYRQPGPLAAGTAFHPNDDVMKSMDSFVRLGFARHKQS